MNGNVIESSAVLLAAFPAWISTVQICSKRGHLKSVVV